MSRYEPLCIVIRCDGGCGREVEAHNATAAQARERASAAGWHFPHRVRRNGAPAKAFDDVCPDCWHGWPHRPLAGSSPDRTWIKDLQREGGKQWRARKITQPPTEEQR